MKRFLFLVLPMFTFISCSVDDASLETVEAISEANAVFNIPGCTPEIWPYVNGGITYGNVEATNDDKFLYITFVATQGLLTEARLQVASSVTEFALNTGDNLQMNNIPKYKFNNLNDKTVILKLSDLGISKVNGQELLVLSRATIGGESSWAGDKTVGKSERGHYFTYKLQTCVTNTPPVECEGAYMHGSQTFQQITGWNENNWGWVHSFEAKDEIYSETRNLYAGAAHSEITIGTLMGTVTTTWNPVTGIVSFDLKPLTGKIGGYKAFVGDVLPEKHSPGQYGDNRYDLDGKFFLIVKAEICK